MVRAVAAGALLRAVTLRSFRRAARNATRARAHAVPTICVAVLFVRHLPAALIYLVDLRVPLRWHLSARRTCYALRSRCLHARASSITARARRAALAALRARTPRIIFPPLSSCIGLSRVGATCVLCALVSLFFAYRARARAHGRNGDKQNGARGARGALVRPRIVIRRASLRATRLFRACVIIFARTASPLLEPRLARARRGASRARASRIMATWTRISRRFQQRRARLIRRRCSSSLVWRCAQARIRHRATRNARAAASHQRARSYISSRTKRIARHAYIARLSASPFSRRNRAGAPRALPSRAVYILRVAGARARARAIISAHRARRRAQHLSSAHIKITARAQIGAFFARAFCFCAARHAAGGAHRSALTSRHHLLGMARIKRA